MLPLHQTIVSLCLRRNNINLPCSDHEGLAILAMPRATVNVEYFNGNVSGRQDTLTEDLPTVAWVPFMFHFFLLSTYAVGLIFV